MGTDVICFDCQRAKRRKRLDGVAEEIRLKLELFLIEVVSVERDGEAIEVGRPLDQLDSARCRTALDLEFCQTRYDGAQGTQDILARLLLLILHGFVDLAGVDERRNGQNILHEVEGNVERAKIRQQQQKGDSLTLLSDGVVLDLAREPDSLDLRELTSEYDELEGGGVECLVCVDSLGWIARGYCVSACY